MIIKFFKTIWLFSLVAVVIGSAYVYASLKEIVLFGFSSFYLTRNTFFIILVSITAVINVVVFITPSKKFTAWVFTMIISINIFLLTTLSYLYIINSGENYDFDRLNYMMYASNGLMLVALLGGIFIEGRKKKKNK